jgi:hypothetical protein
MKKFRVLYMGGASRITPGAPPSGGTILRCISPSPWNDRDKQVFYTEEQARFEVDRRRSVHHGASYEIVQVLQWVGPPRDPSTVVINYGRDASCPHAG